MTPSQLEADLLLDARVDLAEGPIWHPDREQLSWVDLHAGVLHWLALDGTEGPSAEIGRQLGSAIPTTDGAVMLATDTGFARLDDGGIHTLAPVEAEQNSFLNDGKCDALGRFWAGTIAVGDDGLAVPGGGSLYRLELDQSLSQCVTGTTISNGMDWSPGGDTFYYVDSAVGTIDAFDFELENGELRRRRAVISIPKTEGFADGLCVDTDGCIWTAVWGSSEVRRYTPSGAIERIVRLPVTQPTSVIFAGEHLDMLVITSASHLLGPEERARQVHAGSLFWCQPGATGRPTHSCAVGAAG